MSKKILIAFGIAAAGAAAYGAYRYFTGNDDVAGEVDENTVEINEEDLPEVTTDEIDEELGNAK